MKTIIISIENAFKLHSLKSAEMYHQSVEIGYNPAASKMAEQSFSTFYKQMGINDVLEAEKVVNTVWANVEKLDEMQRSGFTHALIPYDLNSIYLMTVQPSTSRMEA